MENNRRIQGLVLMLSAMICCSCIDDGWEDAAEVKISFTCGDLTCKSSDPNEDKITDISVLIFDEKGGAEDSFWLERGKREGTANLLIGKTYIFCACANFGYQVYADRIEELDEIRYNLAYPDEYSQGIPMYAYEKVTIGENRRVDLNLERLMAKISLIMDRSRLSDAVDMQVRYAKIGNCPRSISVFQTNKVRGKEDCFASGFSKGEFDVTELNTDSGRGLSEPVSLYMLENMQGDFGEYIDDDSEKVFGQNDSRQHTCSYIELCLDYMSDKYYSGSKGLIYRFYLGEDRNNLDVERNCHYTVVVAPEDDGLAGDGWRVDKSNLSDRVSFVSYPDSYIVGDIGDEIHIWCEFTPSTAPFDVGLEYLEDDKADGIYDYTIDEDGHGVTLTLTGPGRGMIYMEAGEPVNEAALFVIEVNQPD